MKKILIWSMLMLFVAVASISANQLGSVVCFLDGTNTASIDTMFQIKTLTENSNSKPAKTWSCVNLGPGNVVFSLYTGRDSSSGSGKFIVSIPLFAGQTYNFTASDGADIDSVYIDRAAADKCAFYAHYSK